MNKYVKEFLPYVIIIVVVVLIRSFIVTPIRVSGDSMEPTLKSGNIMILNKLAKINRYDIVVIKSEKSPQILIKRVIGLPGETIEISDGNIYINEKKLKENYGKGNTSDLPKYKIPKNEYFVLGDNRSVSADSRIFGSFNKKDIKGTTKLVLYPFNKFGNVK